MYQALTLGAGVAVEFYEPADFFRVLAAPAVDVSLIFYRNGAEVSQAQNIGAGYAENFEVAYDKLRIQSAGGGAVAFVSRLGGQVRYDTPPNGAVTVTNTSGPVANTQKTVTSASAQLVAANAGRRYLLIQNKDAAGIVYINFGAGAATAANGVKISAGGSYVADANYCPDGAIQAIGDIASNANVVVVEG
jgi:hypothetical protein